MKIGKENAGRYLLVVGFHDIYLSLKIDIKP